jgi:hypothetical protein
MTRLVLCLVFLLPLLEGCGEDAPREEGRAETAPPRETAPLPPSEAPRTITDAESGGSFTLAQHSETSLRLSGDYLWSEPAVRGDAVQLAPVDYFQDPGFSEWLVLAVRPGRATIGASGTPVCAGQEGCSDTPLRFEVTITVAP